MISQHFKGTYDHDFDDSLEDIEKKLLNNILSVIAVAESSIYYCKQNEGIFYPPVPLSYCQWWQTT